MEEKENLFKCPNDLKVTIVKDNGEHIINENCCTVLSILVKNSGEIATSFLGAHSPEMLKVLDKTLKRYFKTLKKTLKSEYKRPDNEEITVLKNDTDANSKEIEEALSKEVEVDIKYEFESLKDIEKATKHSNQNAPSKHASTKNTSIKNTKTNKDTKPTKGNNQNSDTKSTKSNKQTKTQR